MGRNETDDARNGAKKMKTNTGKGAILAPLTPALLVLATGCEAGPRVSGFVDTDIGF
jgi:hypothetical protein